MKSKCYCIRHENTVFLPQTIWRILNLIFREGEKGKKRKEKGNIKKWIHENNVINLKHQQHKK